MRGSADMETFRRIAWALRKVRVPVSGRGLVLDVGAGGCPYPRSDVLLERYVKSDHRCGASLVSDRPTVFADALRMPFKDKAFDFVIASHVLEHVKRPEVFLAELTRVGKAGYIETPNIFLERLSPYPIHVLEVMDCNGKLLIRKKPEEGSDDFLARLRVPEQHAKWSKLFHDAPQMFHVRYFWQDKIEFEIDNPLESCGWMTDVEENGEGEVLETYGARGWRGLGLRTLRRYYAWRRRDSVDWASILACPECRGSLARDGDAYACAACNVLYPADPHPNFVESRPRGDARERTPAVASAQRL
jgi:SAM-dependent methyltransferase